MFNLFVEILAAISLLACFVSVQSADSGSPKSGKGCSKVLTDPSGIITSPNYGPNQKYPGDLACKWTIKAQVGKQINLYFKDFVVEKSRSCRADYLLLYDGDTPKARLIGRYCSARPDPFTSSSNSIHMEFHSDLSLGYRGFFAIYNTSIPATEKPTGWKSRPKFRSTILNKTAIVGDSVRLHCEVDGSPEPTITWRKDSQNVSQDKNIVIQRLRFKSVLTIRKVGKNDQGRYSCEAFNGFGPPLNVHGSLIVEYRKIPLITNITQHQSVSVGNRIKLIKCEADGLAPLNLALTEANKELKSSRCNKNIGCQIQYTKRFIEDTVIKCKVWNTAGNATNNTYIKLSGPPEITQAPKNQTVKRENAVKFTCTAIGNNLTFRWLKDNKQISDGVTTRKNSDGVHSVLQFDAKQNATLTCSVKGKDGETSKNAHVFIIEKKNMTMTMTITKFVVVPNGPVSVNNGDSVTVHCQAEGNPSPTISWSVNDTSTKKLTSLSSKGLTLKLESLRKSVNVVCTAKNKHDVVRSSIIITVNVTKVSARKVESNTSTNDNIRLILGAGAGVLILTGLIILFIVLRRQRNKKLEKRPANEATEVTEAREEENLISNPTYSNNDKDAVGTKPGVDTLHYPRDSIELTEMLENGPDIEMFLGRAVDLPFSPGEFAVVVRALKNADPSEEIKDTFDLEASLLANLVHPNVVRLMAVCIKTPPLGLVFEYSSYGYLDEYLQDCDQSELKHKDKKTTPVVRDSFTELATVDRLSIAKQIASGMKYLSDKGYVHQELRAQNCLVFKDLQVKVANLGLHWAKPDQNFFVMTPEEKQRFPVRWLPPEVVLYGEHTHTADIWSYGILVWEIFSNGNLPYTGINDSDVVSYVRGGNVLPRPKICPHEVYEVMKTCWEIAPQERPDFKSLQDTMTALHAGVPV